MNRIDADVWNPASDQFIAACYSAENVVPKADCKAALQAEAGLPKNPNRPLVAMISRLVEAKGLDLIEEAIEKLAELDAQFFFLGTGKEEYQKLLEKAAEENPDKIATKIDHDDSLAHRVIAGADLFLMPSNYEPCGLTQLYSMRYGTIPVVHKTGGLADSVYHATPESIKRKLGVGFAFENYDANEMVEMLSEALALYRKDKAAWSQLMQNAMAKDFSWDKSAGQYEDLYRHLKDTKSA